MIIAISGKKGSGKDTVAKMIMEMTSQKWENVKFADTLKDMVCLLIGCTREQLEDPKFKETPLGPEWDRLVETSSYGAPDRIYPVGYEGMTHIAHTRKESLTPRLILQLLGTEGVRNVIHPNAWVNATMDKYHLVLKTDPEKDNDGISITYKDFPDWLITDMRFPNELQAIEDKKGITLRVNRFQLTLEDNHPSETALDDAEFDYVISNDSDMEVLRDKVRAFLQEFEII